MTATFSRIDGSEFKDAERALRARLTPGLPAILRLDGRAFHSYCRGLARPYDSMFMGDMNETALVLAEQVDGVRLAYVQSDEISLLLTDRIDGSEAVQGFMFGGQIQKLTSITAAIASSILNAHRYRVTSQAIAQFDSRVFQLPDMDAVQRYFKWRQADARVNSLGMLAATHFSHKQLHGVSTADRADMLRGIGVDPDALPPAFVHGRVVRRQPVEKQTTFFDRRLGADRTVEFTRQEAFVDVAPSFAEGLDESWF